MKERLCIMNTVKIGNFEMGAGNPLVLMAGPCVLEDYERCLFIGRTIRDITSRLGIPYIFKASFDKANRSSFHGFRGPGLEKGLEMLANIKKELGVPVVTDIHTELQPEPVSKVVDVLQIPAFLCRQTDLLNAAAKTGAVVNVKKGQFMAPKDMRNVVDKILAAKGSSASDAKIRAALDTLYKDYDGVKKPYKGKTIDWSGHKAMKELIENPGHASPQRLAFTFKEPVAEATFTTVYSAN